VTARSAADANRTPSLVDVTTPRTVPAEFAACNLPRVAEFGDALNGQVGREYGASQQYVAIAVHFDAETLPQLAAHFYRQAVEERNHAMMIVQYLLDANLPVEIPGVAAPVTSFVDAVAPVQLALDQERSVTDDIVRLAKLARDEGDLVGEQFLHWFLQEQREEVASMSALLSVIQRADGNLLLVEEYLARTPAGEGEPAMPPPAAAGGAL
jgi:ferritin